MPARFEVTVPLPVPLLPTVRVYPPEVPVEKLAVTLLAPFTTSAQLPVPVQAPLQPTKVEPAAGVADRATLVPPA
jgi:hypothetical protein